MLCSSHTKFEIFVNHMKKQNKKHQNANFFNEKLKTKSLMFFELIFFMSSSQVTWLVKSLFSNFSCMFLNPNNFFQFEFLLF